MFMGKKGGGGGGSPAFLLKNTIESMQLFRDTYGMPSKSYKWVNGELVEYKNTYYWSQQIPYNLKFSQNSCKDYSIFSSIGNSISGLFMRIKNLFKKPNFNNFKSTDEKYKMTQSEIHDYLVNEQGLSTEQADQICNDGINIVNTNK